MADRLVFPYVVNRQYVRDERARPFLPIALSNQERRVQTLALVDSGADLNVLPYEVGVKLGGIWDAQPRMFGVSGVVGQLASRGLVVDVAIGNWPVVNMGFAWTRETDVPVILGQISFFSHFNVCFLRSSQQFELEFIGSDNND